MISVLRTFVLMRFDVLQTRAEQPVLIRVKFAMRLEVNINE
jgi:hypothetical protein